MPTHGAPPPSPVPLGPATASSTGRGASFVSSFSRDGQVLVFTSAAPDLAAVDANGTNPDVFAYSLARGMLTLVSANPAGVSGNGPSHAPAISADGSRIVFVSRASDLVANDDNASSDVFLRDLPTSATRRLSVAPKGSVPGDSHSAVISDDGRRVAFLSRAGSLASTAPEGRQNAYVWIGDSDSLQCATPERETGDTLESALDASGRWLVCVTERPPSGSATSGFRCTGHLWDSSRRMLHAIDLPVAVLPFAVEKEHYLLQSPTFSADGRRLAFRVMSSQLTYQAVAIGTFDETGFHLETSSPAQNYHNLVDGSPLEFSSDASTLLLTARDVFTQQPILQMWSDTAGFWTPTNPATGAPIAIREAALASNGSRVAFTAEQEQATQPLPRHQPLRLFSWNRETGGVTPLLNLGNDADPGDLDTTGIVFQPRAHRVAFHARSRGLVDDDHNQASDVFLLELPESGRPTSPALVTHGRSELASPASQSRDSLSLRGLDGDGRRALFLRDSRDDSTPPAPWISELPDGESRPAGFGIPSLGSTSMPDWAPLLSHNGRHIAFASERLPANASTSPNTPGPQVWIRDLAGGRADLAVVGTNRLPAALAQVSHLRLSADGRYVAFGSEAWNLVAGENSAHRIVLRDIKAGRTWVPTLNLFPSQRGYLRRLSVSMAGLGGRILVGLAPSAAPFQGFLFDPVRVSWTYVDWNGPAESHLSFDGRRIFLVDSGTTNAPAPLRIRVIDVTSGDGSDFLPATPAEMRYSIENVSLDGRVLILRERTRNEARPTTGFLAVNVENRTIQRLEDTLAEGWEVWPAERSVSISADGRLVAFLASDAGSPGNTSGPGRVVALHDLETRATTFVPELRPSPYRRGFATGPLLGADGRTLVYGQWSGSGVSPTELRDGDLMTLSLPAPAPVDTDQDGLDDLWEKTWFGNLLRDGTADYDGDGLSELEEARRGSCPIDDLDPIVVSLTARRLVGGDLELAWPTRPGLTYRLRSRFSLDSPWQDLGTGVSGDGSPAVRLVSPNSDSTRFFQVQMTP